MMMMIVTAIIIIMDRMVIVIKDHRIYHYLKMRIDYAYIQALLKRIIC